tara:strand:- start:226 stop:534 length:309 start_codon:yes stop_codon:yes gene_type:complete
MNATPVVERCSDGKLMFDCPGCGLAHAVNVDEGTRPRWGWNGDMCCPTFTPSIRVRWDFGPSRKPKVCHSFVTNGEIQFLNDCTHAHAGKTFPLKPINNEVT